MTPKKVNKNPIIIKDWKPGNLLFEITFSTNILMKKTTIIDNEPNIEAAVPTILTPPDVPAGTDFLGSNIHLAFEDIVPISVAQVSAVAAAKVETKAN